MSLLTQASLVLTPNAVKTSKLYSIIPSNGNGDMTVVRATTATRVNSAGIIESVASNVPRLNYDVAGGCPSILVESQRTNLVPYSEMFADASWIKTNSATVTANTDISPDGTMDADRLTAGASLAQVQTTSTVLSGSAYTVSIWIKRISGTGQVYIRSIENANIPITITNDWVRYSLTTTATSTTGRVGVALQTSGDVVAIWGAQLELGTYSTSYIFTTTAIVTRNTDVITRNNIYTNNLITSAGGTWFIELNNNILLTRDASGNGIWIGDNNTVSTIGNSFNIRHNGGTSRLSINKAVSGTLTGLYTTLTNTVKIAIDWNGSTADVFVNGVKVVNGTSFTATNMEFLNTDGVGGVPKYIKSMMLFPTPLTDTECIALTTL
jgi:hypothetical protein